MRRPARRLFALCSAASLLLCVVVCVLWAQSHGAAIELSFREGDFRRGDPWTIGLGSDRGVLSVRRYRAFSDGYPTRAFVMRQPREQLPSQPPEWGFAVADAPVDRGRPPQSRGYRWHARLPHWLVALALLGPPALLLGRRRAGRRRRRQGLCSHCGYDLRASPGRCLECGTLPAAEVSP